MSQIINFIMEKPAGGTKPRNKRDLNSHNTYLETELPSNNVLSEGEISDFEDFSADVDLEMCSFEENANSSTKGYNYNYEYECITNSVKNGNIDKLDDYEGLTSKKKQHCQRKKLNKKRSRSKSKSTEKRKRQELCSKEKDKADQKEKNLPQNRYSSCYKSKSLHQKRSSSFKRSESPPYRTSKRSYHRSESSYYRTSERSYYRRSESPYCRRSKSPCHRRSGSSYHRRCESPYYRISERSYRRRSKSPCYRRSESSYHRRSESPYCRRSKSPCQRRSGSSYFRTSERSYHRRSGSPYYRISESSYYRRSESLCYRRSESPCHRRLDSPHDRRHKSSNFRSVKHLCHKKSRSPNFRKSRSPRFKKSDSQRTRNFKSSEISNSKMASKVCQRNIALVDVSLSSISDASTEDELLFAPTEKHKSDNMENSTIHRTETIQTGPENSRTEVSHTVGNNTAIPQLTAESLPISCTQQALDVILPGQRPTVELPMTTSAEQLAPLPPVALKQWTNHTEQLPLPKVSEEGLPLIRGLTELPVHVNMTGHQVPYDMDGKRIPVGPNGQYLPLDSSGRLFPHVVSPSNTAVPIYMSEDGVLRLPNFEPVPFGLTQRLPVNTDGSVIFIGPDSRPLFPCPNIPILQFPNTHQATLNPLAKHTENEMIRRPELPDRGSRKTKSNDNLTVPMMESDLNGCDMVLASSDSEWSIKLSPSVKSKLNRPQNKEQISDDVSLRRKKTPQQVKPKTSNDVATERVKRFLKEMIDEDLCDRILGRFAMKFESMKDPPQTHIPHESPLLRNRIKLPLIPYGCEGVENESLESMNKSIDFSFKSAKKNCALVKGKIPARNFSVQCDLTSKRISDLELEISKLKSRIQKLNNKNTGLHAGNKNLKKKSQLLKAKLKNANKALQMNQPFTKVTYQRVIKTSK